MQDMLTQLEKLRSDAAECELIRDLATDFKKRELFDRLAAHFSILASEVEKAILESGKRAKLLFGDLNHEPSYQSRLPIGISVTVTKPAIFEPFAQLGIFE
jgi:hypothetical protein